MKFEVYEITDIESPETYFPEIKEWSQLWWSDFQEAGIDRVWLAFDENDKVVGFQTVNVDRLCVAIEVHENYRRKGIAACLIEESNCFKPEKNENPLFWVDMEILNI